LLSLFTGKGQEVGDGYVVHPRRSLIGFAPFPGAVHIRPGKNLFQQVSIGIGFVGNAAVGAPPDGFVALTELAGPFPCSVFGPSLR